MRPLEHLLGTLLAVAACPVAMSAEEGDNDKVIDNTAQLQIIEAVAKGFNDIYVFPEVAAKMETHLRNQHKNGAYQEITSTVEFARRLTDNLRSVSHDLHIRVGYEPDEFFVGAEQAGEPSEQTAQAEFDEDRFHNFGFVRVDRLPGNVGYLQMKSFYDTRSAGKTAAAAMSFVAHCDAIIIDLRMSLGGSPSMVQLLASYFFDKPVHLDSFYLRKRDATSSTGATRLSQVNV